MKKTFYAIFLLSIFVICNIDARKLSRSRSSGSGRSSGRKQNSNPQPIPTSLSYPQASAPKPSLFGWQEKTSSSRQSKPNNQGHSYPSSNTGLSGNNQPKQSVPQQESIQRSNAPSQQFTPVQKSSQPSHAYPASNSLSGNSNPSSGAGYPQGTGLSGSNIAPPPYQGINTPNYKPQGSSSGLSGSNVAPPPYQSNYPSNSYSNTYHNQPGAPPPYSSSGNTFYHPQGPPPPYFGNSNGVYGGHGYNPQTPGYFGNYMNSGRNFGSVSRTGSALTGVGIAGAGIGTVLTGLALWNLARSTGHRHHTVIYDNRGQPIAVAPDNNTTLAVDPILSDLVNCTLTITNDNATEILAIPCSIATSFTPDASVNDVTMKDSKEDTTKCIVTVLTKAGKEFMTTIPCSILLNSAAENNVTEPPMVENSSDLSNNTSIVQDDKLYADQPVTLTSNSDLNISETITLNCTKESGDIRDPINPCFSVKHNLTVVPLQETENRNY